MANNVHTSTEIRPQTLFLRVTLKELTERFLPLQRELAKGKVIQLIEDGNVVAEVRAPSPIPPMPDFMGRMKALWGDKILPSGTMTNIIREDRDSRG